MTSPFEDRLSIATPEGVDVELVLAGLGSRFVARLLDTLVQAGMVLAWVLLMATVGGAVIVAAGYVAIFLTMFVYDVMFEVLGSGRTPGKRWAGLRVVQDGGGPIGWGSSCVRNVVRLLDFLPGGYLLGAVTIVVTSRGQRVGDLLAGTIVVRERSAGTVALAELGPQTTEASAWADHVAGWDVSAVTAEEVALVRRFLQRRTGLELEARQRLGDDLAGRLWSKVAGVPGGLHTEAFLEGVVAAKDLRS